MNDFHARRRAGLGGSDIAAIFGLSPWRTPMDIWSEKTGRTEPTVSNLAMRYGSHNEDFVASEYAKETGRVVVRHTSMIQMPDRPMIGHIDRLVVPEGQKIAAYRGQIRTDRLLECKTASRPEGWGMAGTDEVPQHYLLQVAHYLALTGCQYGDIAVLLAGREFRIYTIERDIELERIILDKATDWWQCHVVADVPPDPITLADVSLLYPRDDGTSIEMDAHTASTVHELRSLRTISDDTRRKIERLETAIKAAMGHASILTCNGRAVATWKRSRDSAKFDLKEYLSATNPGALPDEISHLAQDIERTYTTIKPGTRRFTLKG